jgi:hypothetical protein
MRYVSSGAGQKGFQRHLKLASDEHADDFISVPSQETSDLKRRPEKP